MDSEKSINLSETKNYKLPNLLGIDVFTLFFFNSNSNKIKLLFKNVRDIHLYEI